MLDSQHTFIDVTVTIGRDVTLYPGTILQGDTTIGEGSEIGPNTRLSDCVVGSGSIVQNTVGRESEIGTDAVVGPFASLPPGCSVSNGQHTGAFYTGQP
jgi:bifunctional UDP-N-acetylglucosamine pyrophosphorylase/glucosamine-1-phosphate N-acetyltransferase